MRGIYLCFFVFAPFTTAPACVMSVCSSPAFAISLSSATDPTGLPPISSTGKSYGDVSRAISGFSTSVSSRTSTSIIVGAGRRLSSARRALTSRETGE